MYSFGDMSFSKASLAGRPAARTQVYLLSELRSALRAPLVTIASTHREQFAQTSTTLCFERRFGLHLPRPSPRLH